mmetsp:Transcript_32074/g.77933  ORF Transcript_32074/g.77933 Transcript_32074/m.77933 type:complete len:287 (-) Transcript_32074:2616-3476(-)
MKLTMERSSLNGNLRPCHCHTLMPMELQNWRLLEDIMVQPSPSPLLLGFACLTANIAGDSLVHRLKKAPFRLSRWYGGKEMGQKKSEENEDLLLAIIQLRSGDQYLSCWSPKRLSTSHQLLVLSSLDTGTETKWGIPLIEDIKASSLTVLSEPSSKSKGAQRSRKAVVFVASTDAEASELMYASFQLQLTTKVSSGSEKRSISILTRKTVSGILKDGTRSIGPISSIFLAGASFRFDLQARCKTRINCLTLASFSHHHIPSTFHRHSYVDKFSCSYRWRSPFTRRP